MQTKEIWKDVPNYIGRYQVSNLGNVKSLKRKWVIKDKILKNQNGTSGYLIVMLSKKSNIKTFQVHQLVTMAFLNHIPNGYNGLIVDHINNNSFDNRLENLQLITARENVTKDKKGGSSKYIGVCWDKINNKWKSAIQINSKIKNLGRFKNEYDAHLAYQKALKNLKI